MDFFGRKQELAELERAYASQKFEFTVIYGRRRVGKTFLIQKYIEDKNCIYYMASQTGALNLQRLSFLVNQKLGLGDYGPVYLDYFSLFQAVGKLAEKERLILVIDEFPYLAESDPGISSVIQTMCDHDWQGTKLHLILCGSSMSFMERQVLSAKSPLYGRRTSQIRLQPFSFFESKEMLAGMTKEDMAILHAVTAGIPDYLAAVNREISLDENLIYLFLTPSGKLFEEPINLLLQELKNPEIYQQILYAIANGASKNKDIADRTGQPSSSLSPYLDNLIELGVIEKEVPYGRKGGRKTLYRMKDGAYRFYYRYVLRFQSQIMTGNGARVYSEWIKEDLPNYMGQAFEAICYEFFDKLNREDKLPGFVLSYGRWWGNNPLEKRGEEIDLVGEGKDFTIFGECKWRNRDFSCQEAESLMAKSQIVPLDPVSHYYIFFTKKDFSADMKKWLAKEKTMLGYSFEKDF